MPGGYNPGYGRNRLDAVYLRDIGWIACNDGRYSHNQGYGGTDKQRGPAKNITLSQSVILKNDEEDASGQQQQQAVAQQAGSAQIVLPLQAGQGNQ